MYVAVVLLAVLCLGQLAALVVILRRPSDIVPFETIPLGRKHETAICREIAGQYNARCEVRTSDGMRCDLVNDEYAIEVERAYKWPESIGQAIFYAKKLNQDHGTKLKPAILLLHNGSGRDARHISRAKFAVDGMGIKVFTHEVDE